MSESETASKEIPRSNVPEFSVGELAFSLKKTLEENYGRVRVRGELSRVSIAASGHMYSSLKDDNAVIDSVCWKGTMAKLSVRPEEGLEVIVTGRISTYPQRSNYQLIIESMELAGEGALLKMLEERKKKLAAEGLFDESRKRALPFLPTVIGVVTSPTGAVIRDILHRLEDRFPRHVILWPAVVQGDAAAAQIASAIDGFQTLANHGHPKPDLLIVGRGGGSLEDLMPFNEEIVVRAIANSQIPIISAVGHETDTTLADFAADLRAPTPTGAAEMAVPVRMNLIAQVRDNEQRIISAMSRTLTEQRHKLEASAAKLGDPAKLLETQSQRLDHIGERMGGVFREYLSVKHRALIERSARLKNPADRLREEHQKFTRWSEQLTNVSTKLTENFEKKLEHAGKMLEAYSFENVLQRGFAVIQDTSGALITQAPQTTSGQAVHIRFKNNQRVNATIGQGTKESSEGQPDSTQNAQSAAPLTPPQAPPKRPKKKKPKATDDTQTSLF